jgi:hypothetical protein
VHADLDTLVTALYVTIDDLFGPRPGPGRKPKLSDAELVCLAVAQVLLGCGTERRWLRFANQRLGGLFSYLPTPRPRTGGCAGPPPSSPSSWVSWRPERRAGGISCGWSTPLRCPARPPGRP